MVPPEVMPNSDIVPEPASSRIVLQTVDLRVAVCFEIAAAHFYLHLIDSETVVKIVNRFVPALHSLIAIETLKQEMCPLIPGHKEAFDS